MSWERAIALLVAQLVLLVPLGAVAVVCLSAAVKAAVAPNFEEAGL